MVRPKVLCCAGTHGRDTPGQRMMLGLEGAPPAFQRSLGPVTAHSR